MRVCSVCQKFHDSSVRCEVEGAATDRDQSLRADMIPGYELIELVSSKRSSDAYLAREISSQRSCIIKVLSADGQSSDRLLSEAKFAAGLFHPAVVDIYEAEPLDDDRCYVVAAAPAGSTLRDVLDNIGSPGLLDSIDIIRQAAEALHTLHLAGLVHRAINPSNIVLSATSSGKRSVKLQNIDFGGAGQRAVISSKFTIDSELDTLKYFAPEQFDGEDADSRSDVYSLGIVFYEMLAGRTPFDASTAVALIHKQKNQTPPDIRIDNFNLRMLVTHALSESLQKRPSARQPSANLLARQLRHIEQLATRVSTPPPAGTPLEGPDHQRAVAVEMMPIRYVPPTSLRTIARDPFAPVEPMPEVVNESQSKVVVAPAVGCGSVAAESPELKSESDFGLEKATEDVAEVSAHLHSPRRSRLKGWKKRLHQLAEDLAARARERRAAAAEFIESRLTSAVIELESDRAAEEQPRKIEWQQPGDDIPSVSDAEAALALDGIQTLFVENETEIAPAYELIPAPLDEAPREDAVVVTELEPIDKTAIAVQEAPGADAVIASESDQDAATPEPVITSIPGAPVRLPQHPAQMLFASDPIAAAPADPPPLVSPRTPSFIQLIEVEPQPVADASEVHEDPIEHEEEITLVRPPRGRRITVSLDRQTARRTNLIAARKTSVYARQQREFVPTLLGGAAQLPPAVVLGDDAMFSAYASTRAGRSYRSTFIAIALFGVTSLLLFGNDSVTRYFQTWTAADSVAGTRPQAPQQPEQVAALKTRGAKKSDKLTTTNRNGIAADRGSAESKTKLTALVKPVKSGVRMEDRKKQLVNPPASAASPTRPRVVGMP